MSDRDGLTVAQFNQAPEQVARDLLAACCAAPTWVQRVLATRPYDDRDALLEAADTAFAGLQDTDIDAALADHPRIGARVQGTSASADLSRGEQSAMVGADERVKADILAGNQAYERRFDRVFLIRAAGREPAQILTELRRRLDNDPTSESREVHEQLQQITRLRLEDAIS